MASKEDPPSDGMTSGTSPVGQATNYSRRASSRSWRDFDPADFRVLVADDLDDTRFVLNRGLSVEGYEIIEVVNGEELVDRTLELEPDLLIVDIMMPKMDGLSALRLIRQERRLDQPYVILLTGKSSVDEKIEGFQLGADDYVTKPYSLAELKARVQAGIRIKAMQRNLAQSHRIIMRQEKLATIGVMAAGIAHEFNNIMSGISGYAQLARKNEKFIPTLIDIALKQSDRARSITNSLSSFASTANNASKRIHIKKLIDSALFLLDKEFRSRDIEPLVEIEPDLPEVDVNQTQVQEALVHILLNAVQAVQNLETDRKVRLKVHSDSGRILLEIEDNGPGVRPQDRERVFDPFFTTKGALANADEPGTGLGLTFALNTVRSHEGNIELSDSELGGAKVRVELPAVESLVPVSPKSRTGKSGRSENASEPKKSPDTRPEASVGPLQILSVEDDPVLQNLIAELRPNDRIVSIGEGLRALEHLRDEGADFVILDIGLRGELSGLDVLEAMRELDSQPPVLLTTGSAEFRPEEIEYSNLSFLPKPFGIGDLERAITELSEKI